MPVVSTEAPSGLRWFTDSGIAIPVVTTEQMREIDRVAVEETGPNLYQMMENAGWNLALQVMEILGATWNRAGIIVLAGSGGNGGGGICAARHLANRGANVKLCLAEPHRLGAVPALQRRIFDSAAGTEIGIADLERHAPDLIVDALIGYGLASAPVGTTAELIRWANHTRAPILALDVPSGVDSTTGHTPGDFIAARWTMTLALPKSGLAPDETGDLVLADIGIPRATFDRAGVPYASPFDNRFRVPLTRR
jgi:NAD(P)H-hydrate epimerase